MSVEQPNYDEIVRMEYRRLWQSEEFQAARMRLFLTCQQYMMDNPDCLDRWLDLLVKAKKEQGSHE